MPVSEVRNFFRFCPACGKRFHIKLVSRKLVGEREERTVAREEIPVSIGGGMPNPIMVGQDVPITVDIEDFQYSYKCKHCGHQWSELRTKESRE